MTSATDSTIFQIAAADEVRQGILFLAQCLLPNPSVLLIPFFPTQIDWSSTFPWDAVLRHWWNSEVRLLNVLNLARAANFGHS